MDLQLDMSLRSSSLARLGTVSEVVDLSSGMMLTSNTSHIDFFPRHYILSPSDALALPGDEELRERYGDEYEQVRQEHQADAALLESYIEQADIERYVADVMNA